MKVLAKTGTEDVAVVYVAEMSGGRCVEFVESVQPPLPREEKWVLLVSTLFGCPVGCRMCDAGGGYQGKLSRDEILAQVDFLVARRYPGGEVPCRQFKIQFARMGEPALNRATLEALRALAGRYRAPGLMPSVSTIAPAGCERFLDELAEIKRSLYAGGRFQFQFSIHTTDAAARRRLIPARTWDFAQMAAYGEKLYAPGDRKITLNFALAGELPVEAAVLRRHFDPQRFLIKVTPLNPTYRARQEGLHNSLEAHQAPAEHPVLAGLLAAGYEVIVSIGELEENLIGSNCGQYLRAHLQAQQPIPAGYAYPVVPLAE